MTTFSNSPRLVRAPSSASTSSTPAESVISFQYNPDTLPVHCSRRAWRAQRRPFGLYIEWGARGDLSSSTSVAADLLETADGNAVSMGSIRSFPPGMLVYQSLWSSPTRS
jgi:hypothetical protein